MAVIMPVSEVRLRDHVQGNRTITAALRRGSLDTLTWAHLGSISATDYVYIGTVSQDCEVVEINAGAEDLVSNDGDETYTLAVHKDNACDAAAGTAVMDTLTLTRATDDGVIKAATLKTDGSEDVDESSTPLFKAGWTLGGTTPSAVNPWITVTVAYILDKGEAG